MLFWSGTPFTSIYYTCDAWLFHIKYTNLIKVIKCQIQQHQISIYQCNEMTLVNIENRQSAKNRLWSKAIAIGVTEYLETKDLTNWFSL